MVKIIYQISTLSIIIVILISCQSSQNVQNNLDLEELSLRNLEKVRNKLIEEKQDTIIIYGIGCSGCIAKARERTFYVIYKEDIFERVIKVNSKGIYESLPIKDIINFYKENAIEIDEAKNSTEIWISHYHYKSIEILISQKIKNKYLINLSYPTYPIEENKLNRFLGLIDSQLIVNETSIQWSIY